MKKFFALALSATVIACALLFSACGSLGNTTDNADGIENGHLIVYAFTADAGVADITDDSSMYDYMCALKDNGDLVFDGNFGGNDFYITSVMGITSKTDSITDNSYSGWDWMIYTTLTTYEGVIYSGDDTVEAGGLTFYSSLYYANNLPCIEGQSYALVYQFNTMTW